LQSAARGFDSALANGGSPAVAARREFEGEKDKTTWDTLKDLGKSIIRNTRGGQPVTLSSIDDLTKENQAANAIRRSVQATIKTPAYQQRLDAASELHVRNEPQAPGFVIANTPSAPQGPAIQARAPQGPAMGRTGAARTIIGTQTQKTAQRTEGASDIKKDGTGDAARSE
jgi:hypothetical protein